MLFNSHTQHKAFDIEEFIEEFRKENNEKFAQVDKRFDQIQNQIDGLTKLITELQSRNVDVSS